MIDLDCVSPCTGGEFKEIHNYDDFTAALLQAGFSMGGGNDNGIFSLVSWEWKQAPPYETAVEWHTGNQDTDPWEWRMRVLDDRDDIAYAKLFFKKSGYITKDWYPYFLKVRREGMSFEEKYSDGTASYHAKCIYEAFKENDTLPVEKLKQLAGFSKEDKSKFDRALIELQTGMFITMCGRQRKRTGLGEEYGWSSTVFCTTERFFGEEVFEKADELDYNEAVNRITEQIYKLNPKAEVKKIMRFITG